jgi:hypothetical protein
MENNEIVCPPTWLLDLVAACSDAEELRRSLLFHGTCEPIEGRLQPGGYDGVFWTSDSPMIAQSYIPASGVSAGFSFPSEWALNERVRPPDKRSTSVEFSAAIQMGHQLKSVKYNEYGRLQSYAWHGDLSQWPTVSQVMNFLDSLGYSKTNKNNYTWVKCEQLRDLPIKMNERSGSEDALEESENLLIQTLLPSSHRMKGQLWLLPKLDFKWMDIAAGKDSDLTDLDYHKHSTFRYAKDHGFDGIIINDFAQTDEWGNLGHVSYGLFDEAIKKLYDTNIEPFAIDAKRFLIDEKVPSESNRRCPLLTNEFDQFFSQAKQLAENERNQNRNNQSFGMKG